MSSVSSSVIVHLIDSTVLFEWKNYATVLRRVRVNPRIAGTELAGTERGTPIPIPPPTRWRPSLTRNPRNTAETRGITRGPVKHSHTFGREFHSVQNLGSTIE